METQLRFLNPLAGNNQLRRAWSRLASPAKRELQEALFYFFLVLDLELRTYTLSHSTRPFFL
jgi:hypothetical protein